MATDALHERLRQARLSRGDRLDALARRTGIRPSWLQAIEAARYEDLPRGIYARSAIKAYAEALGFDGAAATAEVESLLPSLEDPIEGLARMQGIRRATTPSKPKAESEQQRNLRQPAPAREQSTRPRAVRTPSWRPAAAAAIDAAIILSLLTMLITVTVATFRIPLHAFGPGAAPAFGTVGVLMAIGYFVLFGGIAGETAGTQLVGLHMNRTSPRLDLPAAGVRAFRSAVRDAQVIEDLAAWAVSFTGAGRSSTSPHDTRPVGQAIGS